MDYEDLLDLGSNKTPEQKTGANIQIGEGANLADNSVKLSGIGQIGNSITGVSGEEVQGILNQVGNAFLGSVSVLAGQNADNVATLISANANSTQTAQAMTSKKIKNIVVGGGIIAGMYLITKSNFFRKGIK